MYNHQPMLDEITEASMQQRVLCGQLTASRSTCKCS